MMRLIWRLNTRDGLVQWSTDLPSKLKVVGSNPAKDEFLFFSCTSAFFSNFCNFTRLRVFAFFTPFLDFQDFWFFKTRIFSNFYSFLNHMLTPSKVLSSNSGHIQKSLRLINEIDYLLNCILLSLWPSSFPSFAHFLFIFISFVYVFCTQYSWFINKVREHVIQNVWMYFLIS